MLCYVMNSLRFNALGSDGAQYLASALYVNNGLRFVCLSCNDLCGLDSMGDGDYDLTGFAALMRALQVNTKVRTMKLAENDIGSDGAKHISDALRENTKLMVIDLHGNNLFGGVEDSLAIDETTMRERTMTIDVSVLTDNDENKMDESSHEDCDKSTVTARMLRDIVDEMVEHVSRNESSDSLTGSCSSSPSPSLLDRKHFSRASSSLKRAEDNSGIGGAELLFNVGSSITLSSIDLSWNDLGPRGVNVLVTSILANGVSSLTYLDLHGNPLRDEGISSLARLVGSGTSCKIATLNLQLVGMSSRGASFLGDALASNVSLTKMNISSNNIEASGSEKLSMGLRFNKTITDLNMRQCGLCSEGIAHIANMLQYNRSLTTLNLSSNAIDDDGATSLAATIAINKSLQTLDLSNYIKHFSQPVSSSSVRSPSKQSAPKIKITRRLKPKTSSGRIEESGMEVLALSIRSNQVHLKKLILKGHWLTPKSEEEILSAMDFRRICLVEANFPTMKQRHDEIINTMKTEREVLTSCYTPAYLRLHMCGQDSRAKLKLLQGWRQGQVKEQRDELAAKSSFYSSIFSQNTTTHMDVPGVGKTTVLLKEKINILKKTVDPAVEVGIWSYDGGHDFQNIFRLHMRGAPLGVGLICSSMVGNDKQCRSADDISKELFSWISLMLTYGHNARDLAVVFTNGEEFDKAWKGLNPLLGQKMASDLIDATESTKSDKSIDRSTSAEEQLDESKTAVDVKDINNSLHSVSLLDNSTSLHKNGDEKKKSFESLLDRSTHSVADSIEDASCHDSKNPNKEFAANRKKFEDSIRENLKLRLGSSFVPHTYAWDEGHGSVTVHPKIETWLRDRYKHLSKHIRVPSVCKVLREQCLPLLRARETKVIDINELLKEGQKHVRCLQNLELRHACQWLHQLGDIVIVDVTVQGDSVFHEIESKILPGNDDTKKENKLYKIILDPSWFSENVLVPIVGRPSSLSMEVQCTQPWGGKEFLLSSQHIQELTSPIKTKLGMSHVELLQVLEHFRIGTVMTCHNVSKHMSEKVLLVPCRLSDTGKLEWLRSRGVAHIPLSQSSTDPPAVTAVLARRISPRKPFIIPPSFFACIQSEVLCAFEQGGNSPGGYKVVCWDKGLGIWRDEMKGQGSVKVGSVCCMIECTPKWVHNNWSQNPDCSVDIIVWGEGFCTSDIVLQTMSIVMRIVQKSGDIVLNGSLRSINEDEEDEKSLVENPYSPTLPMINWLKVSYLRPGCALHTLSLSPIDRNCGEYFEEPGREEPNTSPVLVSCHHPQPRLTKDHLVRGYVLADSPGGGKGLLRSISGALAGLEVTDESSSGTKAACIYDHPYIDFQVNVTMASE